MTTQIAPRGRSYEFTIGDRVRAAREQVGLEQAELADATGISRNSISNYERGATTPRRGQLALIALATGFDFEWLATGISADNGDPATESSITRLSRRNRWALALAS